MTNRTLFVMCRNPANCVVLNAADGKILATLPIGRGSDGGGFNSHTMEAFSSQGDGTLTIIKKTSPFGFAVIQTVETKPRAKTCTLDLKTNRIVLITTEPMPTAETPAAPGGDAGKGVTGGAKKGKGNTGPSFLDILAVGR